MNPDASRPPAGPFGRLSRFFELSRDLMIIASYEGYFLRLNPAAIDFFGFPEEELYSRPIMSFVHPEDLERTLDSRRQVTRGGQLMQFENRYLTSRGPRWLSWTSIPHPEEQLVYAIAKDVSWRKREEEEKSRLTDTVLRINRELREFSYVCSHDLRAPVKNLQSLLDLMQELPDMSPEAGSLTEMLNRSVQQLDGRLNDLLYALQHQGDPDTRLEPCRFQEALDRTLNAIGQLVREAGAELKADFHEAPELLFSKTYLDSVLLNLISNALRYRDPKRPLEIRLRSFLKEGRICLDIEDTGLGFPLDQVKDRVFGLFQKFSNHPDSRGMGLYLVHSMLSALGADIDLSSTPGQGTLFQISFAAQALLP